MKKKESLTRFFLPTLADLVFILVFYLVLQIGSMLFADGDPGRHITAGKYMLETGSILTKDIFSYTMLGQPITPHEWLAQVSFGLADLLMGLNGVVLLTAIILGITFTLLYRDILQQKPTPLLAAAFSFLAALATSLHWLARPHIFTLLIFTLWVGRLRRVSQDQKVPIWQFPIIMLFWVNTHGAFIAGFLTWLIYMIGWLVQNWIDAEKPSTSVFKRLSWVGGLSFLVSFINPVGWHLWQTSIGYISNHFLVDLTIEYASPNFHQLISYPALIFLGLAIFLLSRGWKKCSWTESLLLAAWVAMGLYSVRNMPLFTIVATPIIAGLVQSILAVPGEKKVPERLSWYPTLEDSWSKIEFSARGILWPLVTVLVVTGLLISGVRLDPQRQGYHFRGDVFPVNAVNWLESNPQQGNMFNEFGWGGYLIYRLWPEYKVFMDGQLDFYGETLTRQHQQLLNADPGWEDIIQQYKIQWVIIRPDRTLAHILEISPGWVTLYQDQTAIIFRKE